MAEARFRVDRLLKLSGREGIFVCGDIVEGTIAVGMKVRWPVPGETRRISVPISAVEYLDVDRAAGRTEIALCIRFEKGAGGSEHLFQDLLEPGMVVGFVSSEEADE